MKTRRIVTNLICFVVLSIATQITVRGMEPTYVDIEPFFDDFGSGGFVDVTANIPENSIVTLQCATDIKLQDWVDCSAPVFSASANTVVFSAPTEFPSPDSFPNELFYRLKIETIGGAAGFANEEYFLKLEDGAPKELLFEILKRDLKFWTYGGEDIGASTLLPETNESGPNVEDLLAKLPCDPPIWSLPPFKDDDETYAKRLLLPPDRRQINPLKDDPADVGEGEIDKGFDGIPGLPLPEFVERDIPPSEKNDKGLAVEIPDVKDGAIQEIDPNFQEPGHHLRLLARIKPGGGLDFLSAFEGVGDSLLPDPSNPSQTWWPPNPGIGSLIVIVSSPMAGQNLGGIYSIQTFGDPFEIRSYDPPPESGYRGSHGFAESEIENVRFPVPLFEKDREMEGLEVGLYRVVKPSDFDRLDPETFLRNQEKGLFELIGTITGKEILELLNQKIPPIAAPPSPAAASKAATVTQLHRSGSRASKFNFVIIGDGFRDTATDQNAFNDYVQDTVMDELFSRDIHPEIMNAMNVFRINTFSVDTGVTLVNNSGTVTTTRSTALEYRYSGVWNRCWMEPGPNTVTRIDNAVNALVPEADVIAVVLNVTSGGGCSRSHHFAVTRASSWATFAHEFGHFFGGLQDEYQCNQGAAGCGTFTGSEPSQPNQTKVTTRNNIKWRRWIPSTRPVPTAQANIADTSQDTGLFPGATRGNQQWWNGIFRPSWRGRMNNNTPTHNPVGYTEVRDNARPRQDADFRKSVVGDFNGDGRTDLVILDQRQLSLYIADDRDVAPNDPVTGSALRPATGVLEPTWYHTDILRNAAGTRSWEFRGSDILVPGDFDGDGLTDLYVINLTAWNIPYLCMLKSFGDHFEPVRRYDLKLPGWDDMRRHDEFYAADFSGDGRDDLLVYNGRDWNIPYFLMLRSDGDRLLYSRRYDRFLPGWEMGDHEKFFVGDYNGDGREEVISQNTQDWNQVHLMVFRSTGSQLALTDRFYGEIRIDNGLFWTMRNQDELTVLNFNGDRTTDLAIFNGRNWGPEYLALFACDENGDLQFRRRYEDTIPGWDMRRRDTFRAANFDGDDDDDLVVYNALNWSTQYLGMLRSNGSNALAGTWQDDWIGSWNLGSVDRFHVADFRGSAGWVDLFVYNKNWFGLLRSYQNRYVLEAIYPKWIHNHRFHEFGWW